MGQPSTGQGKEDGAALWHDAQRVFDLITDERHLTAQTLYKSVQSRLTAWQQQQQQTANKKKNSPHKSKKSHFWGRRPGGTGGKKDATTVVTAGTTPTSPSNTSTQATPSSPYDKVQALFQERKAELEKLEVSFCTILFLEWLCVKRVV
jgi:hypothetical protein